MTETMRPQCAAGQGCAVCECVCARSYFEHLCFLLASAFFIYLRSQPVKAHTRFQIKSLWQEDMHAHTHTLAHTVAPILQL